MKTFKKIGNIYDDKTSSDYYKAVGEEVEGKIETNAENSLLNMIPQNFEGKTVLDLGCGNGRHAEVFCKRGAKKVIAMDLSESMLEKVRERKSKKQLSQLELVQADMDELSMGKNKFDFIFSRFSLVHSGKMQKVIGDLAQILTDEGEILIATNVVKIVNQDCGVDLSNPIPLIISHDETKVIVKDFSYTDEEYLSAFKKCGLKIIANEKFPYVDELIVDPNFPNRDAITFSYGIYYVTKKNYG